MNVDAARSSSVVSSDSENSSSSGASLDEFHRNNLQGGEVPSYQFEPRRDSNNGSGESAASKTTKICLLMRTNLWFVWATLTGKTSYFIVYIDKLYFHVPQLSCSQ